MILMLVLLQLCIVHVCVTVCHPEINVSRLLVYVEDEGLHLSLFITFCGHGLGERISTKFMTLANPVV